MADDEKQLCEVIGDIPVNRVTRGNTILLSTTIAAQFRAQGLVNFVPVLDSGAKSPAKKSGEKIAADKQSK